MIMKKLAISVCVLTFSGLILSTPAAAGCVEDLDELAGAMTSVDTGASDEAMQQAVDAMDDARALCGVGDEDGAAAKIAETKSLLGLPT
jgi:hypothetical protein